MSKQPTSAPDHARHAREELGKIVSAISAFEGSKPSDFYRAEREKFVSGEISADQLHRRVVDYWTRTRSVWNPVGPRAI
jgi:hypothetical protein